MRTPLSRCGLIALVALIAATAEGAGRYNMPTSLSQCIGYGYGAGYHAPLHLAPPWVSGVGPERIHRVPAGRAGAFSAPSTFVAPISSQPRGFAPNLYQPTPHDALLHGAPPLGNMLPGTTLPGPHYGY